MDMAPLRHGLPKCWPLFEAVSFEDGNRIKMIGEHPRGHQSSQATADHDCMLAAVIPCALFTLHSIEPIDSFHQACASKYSTRFD
jgi:hypothetical protein